MCNLLVLIINEKSVYILYNLQKMNKWIWPMYFSNSYTRIIKSPFLAGAGYNESGDLVTQCLLAHWWLKWPFTGESCWALAWHKMLPYRCRESFLYPRLKNGRIMLWQCPSVCPSVRPSVRPSFPDFFSTCFEISIWNLVYAFSRWHDM